MMNDFQHLRDLMVKNQLKRRGIRDERILDAFRTIPRHEFVPAAYQNLAYQDRPLPIGDGQTISQPYIVALMTELINPEPDHKILEIGTGSGYQAAILSQLVKEVFTIERHHVLFHKTAQLFETLGYTNIQPLHGDGSQGLPDEAPFDAILVTAAAPKIPNILLNQLKNQGKIVAPVGERTSQILMRWTKQADGSLTKEELSAVAFVPLRGEHGWLENEWPED
jgi:protein-L-isoaspartate(D-aspartate) O-methyltransferase